MIETHHRRPAPPLWLGALACILLTGLMAWLRLYVYHDRVLSIGFGLPLMVTLWHRRAGLLWAMAAAFVAVTVTKVFWFLPNGPDEAFRFQDGVMMLANVLAISAILHAWVSRANLIDRQTAELRQANAELEATNEELAAREEEIARQNEELQNQTHEMEYQEEELRQSAEELEAHAEQLRAANEKLSRREASLQTLLESATWLENLDEKVFNRLCGAVLEVLPGSADAVAIAERAGDQLVIRGHAGFGPSGPVKRNWAFEPSLASLAIEQGKTAYIEDISLRPDIEMPQAAGQPPFQSLLVAPLRVEGQITGGVEILSRQIRHWSEEEFQIAQWAAAQCALVLGALARRRELQQRTRESEEQSIRKTRFLAAVSHDVRTPANAISLMAELISRTFNDPGMLPQLPKLASDLQSNARSLVALVSDVLDLARFDSGGLDVQISEFAVPELLAGEVRQHLPLAQSKGLTLEMDAAAQRWLRTDRTKLSRIVGNLIGNAIKFTEKGGIRVRFDVLPEGGQISIIDTGIGIAPEHQESIFDEFFQLRNPERDRTKGSGLGLAISRRLADALGCALSVTSVPGEGSTFVLRLPAEIILPAPTGENRPQPSEPIPIGADGALRGLRVLLVEDHATTRRATAHLLELEGAEVAVAADGREAMQMLERVCPHVLLLDLMLPDIDGSEVLRYLQQRRPSGLQRILAVSGDVTEARRVEVRQLGAHALVPKPVNLALLVQAIRAGQADGDGLNGAASPAGALLA